MKLYIQTNADSVVTDVITYPHGDYVEIEHELPLPDGLLGGWYRWVDGGFAFDQQLYDALHPEEGAPPVDLLAQADLRILELEHELILAKEGLL